MKCHQTQKHLPLWYMFGCQRFHVTVVICFVMKEVESYRPDSSGCKMSLGQRIETHCLRMKSLQATFSSSQRQPTIIFYSEYVSPRQFWLQHTFFAVEIKLLRWSLQIPPASTLAARIDCMLYGCTGFNKQADNVGITILSCKHQGSHTSIICFEYRCTSVN